LKAGILRTLITRIRRISLLAALRIAQRRGASAAKAGVVIVIRSTASAKH
jgi:hypothetical protein